jgi:hypothetical protein
MVRILNTVAGVIGLLLILLALLAMTGSAFGADGDLEKRTQEAREALNNAEYAEAARLYAQARALTTEKQALNKVLYWEAFSRYRLQRTAELKQAAELLSQQEIQYAEREIAAESEALAARINAELAQRGEVGAARRVREQASDEEIRLETRVTALQALLLLDQERALPMLEKIIRDDSLKNRELRQHAVMLACTQDTPQFQQLLLGLLDTETDPDFLAEITMCLAMNPSPEVLEKLMELFRRNKSPQVAEAILFSAVSMDDDKTSDQVFQFLATIAQDKSEDPGLREQALFALSHVGREEEVLEILVGICGQDQERNILESALFAISNLDVAAADETLRVLIQHQGMDEEFKAQALFAVSRHGRASVDFLREVFMSARSGDLKLQVFHILSRHDDQEAALDAMLEFAKAEKDPKVKQEMVFWLGQFDDPRAADFLVEILNKD